MDSEVFRQLIIMVSTNQLWSDDLWYIKKTFSMQYPIELSFLLVLFSNFLSYWIVYL